MLPTACLCNHGVVNIFVPRSIITPFLLFKRLLFSKSRRKQGRVTSGSTTFQFHSPTEIMEIFFGQKNKSNRTIFPEIFKLMTACHCILVCSSERVFRGSFLMREENKNNRIIQEQNKSENYNSFGLVITKFQRETSILNLLQILSWQMKTGSSITCIS